MFYIDRLHVLLVDLNYNLWMLTQGSIGKVFGFYVSREQRGHDYNINSLWPILRDGMKHNWFMFYCSGNMLFMINWYECLQSDIFLWVWNLDYRKMQLSFFKSCNWCVFSIYCTMESSTIDYVIVCQKCFLFYTLPFSSKNFQW